MQQHMSTAPQENFREATHSYSAASMACCDASAALSVSPPSSAKAALTSNARRLAFMSGCLGVMLGPGTGMKSGAKSRCEAAMRGEAVRLKLMGMGGPLSLAAAKPRPMMLWNLGPLPCAAKTC